MRVVRKLTLAPALTSGWPRRAPQGESPWPTFKNAPPDVLEVVYKKLADGSYAHYVDDE